MDPDILRQWKRGHEAVNAFEREERRRASPEKRFHQLAALMRLGRGLGLPAPDPFDPEIVAVRERWARLRKALG